MEENFHPLWINFRCLRAIIFVHVSRNLFWGSDLTDSLLPEQHGPFSTLVSLQHLHWAWARIHIYETYVDTFPFLGKCINRILLSTCRYYINTKLCILCGCHVSFICVFLASPNTFTYAVMFQTAPQYSAFFNMNSAAGNIILQTFSSQMKVRKQENKSQNRRPILSG